MIGRAEMESCLSPNTRSEPKREDDPRHVSDFEELRLSKFAAAVGRAPQSRSLSLDNTTVSANKSPFSHTFHLLKFDRTGYRSRYGSSIQGKARQDKTRRTYSRMKHRLLASGLSPSRKETRAKEVSHTVYPRHLMVRLVDPAQEVVA